jgi:hypothetical protein
MGEQTVPVLSKAAILAAEDIPMECVDMRPYGWPGVVYVCGLSGAGRDAWESSLIRVRGTKHEANLHNARAKLLQRCLCNERRELLFEEEEIEQLGTKSGRALDYLFGIAKRLSGIGDDEVKELVKNSEPNQGDSSSSV